MNRRHFIGGLASALAGFTILPAATTYGRVWKAVRSPLITLNPDYINAPYEVGILVWPSLQGVPLKMPLRFNEKPPENTWIHSGLFQQWAWKHSINPFIKKPQPLPYA